MRAAGLLVSTLAVTASGVWLRCQTHAAPYTPDAIATTSPALPAHGTVATPALALHDAAVPVKITVTEEEGNVDDAAAPSPTATPTPAPIEPPPSFANAIPFVLVEMNLGCAAGCVPSALPASHVKLSPFWFDRDEVSAADYATCVIAGACTPASCDDDAPRGTAASCVDWYAAAGYCAWRGGRLPTEAEWEAAARYPDERSYPWGNDPRSCAGGTASDVNASGVRDLAGGVAEWVHDFAGGESLSGVDPFGPATGQGRVIKGGDGCAAGVDADLRRRRELSRIERQPWLGFRCTWSPPHKR